MNILLIFLGFLILLFIIIFIIQSIKIRKLSTKPKNNVHFYVARDKYDARLWLYLRKPVRNTDSWIPCDIGKALYPECKFKNLGLNKDDFENLKWEDGPVEIFLNMED